MGDVRVRCFRPKDSDEVRELFWLAMATGPGSPRRTALNDLLTRPIAGAAYTLIVLGLSVASMARSRTTQVFGVILSFSVAAMFLGYRYLLSKFFTDLFEQWLTEDLADIPSYYRVHPAGDSDDDFVASGPSGFWVVESDLPDKSGTEIVGTIALDVRHDNGVVRGELRRMNVSPYHRRKGIAVLLVRTLVDHARKHRIPSVDLTTTHFQKAARRLYAKLGWLEVRRTVTQEACGVIRVVLVHFRLELHIVGAEC